MGLWLTEPHKDVLVVWIAQCLFNMNAGSSRRGHHYGRQSSHKTDIYQPGLRGRKRPYQRASYSAYCWLFGTTTVCTFYFNMCICLFGNNLKLIWFLIWFSSLICDVNFTRNLSRLRKSRRQETMHLDLDKQNLSLYIFIHYLLRYPTRRETQCGQYNILCN
jgi:hypothetical protein